MQSDQDEKLPAGFTVIRAVRSKTMVHRATTVILCSTFSSCPMRIVKEAAPIVMVTRKNGCLHVEGEPCKIDARESWRIRLAKHQASRERRIKRIDDWRDMRAAASR